MLASPFSLLLVRLSLSSIRQLYLMSGQFSPESLPGSRQLRVACCEIVSTVKYSFPHLEVVFLGAFRNTPSTGVSEAD